MRVGVAVDLSSTEPVRPQVDRVASLLHHAEACGFDSAWAGESYHATPQPFHLPASLLVLAHLAGRTSLPLGTAVLLLRAYRPEKLAYEAALLDQLTEGRFTLGLGLGSPEVAERTGHPRERPAGAAFDAVLRTLRSAWAGSGGTGSGGTGSGGTGSGDASPGTSVAVPGPVKPGGPDLLVGGKTAPSVRRAVELADGWYGATNYTDELLLQQAAAYWSLRDRQDNRRSDRPGEVAVTRFCLVHEDADTARRLADQHFAAATGYYTARQAWAGVDGPASPELPLVGSPAQVEGALRRYADAGVTSVQLRITPHGTPEDVSRQTLSLVGDQVLPALDDPAG